MPNTEKAHGNTRRHLNTHSFQSFPLFSGSVRGSFLFFKRQNGTRRIQKRDMQELQRPREAGRRGAGTDPRHSIKFLLNCTNGSPTSVGKNPSTTTAPTCRCNLCDKDSVARCTSYVPDLSGMHQQTFSITTTTTATNIDTGGDGGGYGIYETQQKQDGQDDRWITEFDKASGEWEYRFHSYCGESGIEEEKSEENDITIVGGHGCTNIGEGCNNNEDNNNINNNTNGDSRHSRRSPTHWRRRATREQLSSLDFIFGINPKPDTFTKCKLSELLGMTSHSVNIWYVYTQDDPLRGPLYLGFLLLGPICSFCHLLSSTTHRFQNKRARVRKQSQKKDHPSLGCPSW